MLRKHLSIIEEEYFNLNDTVSITSSLSIENNLYIIINNKFWETVAFKNNNKNLNIKKN